MMSISTIILLALIIVCAALAVHRLVKRGMCDCRDHCDGHCHGCGKQNDPHSKDSCVNCEAVKKMAATLDNA